MLMKKVIHTNLDTIIRDKDEKSISNSNIIIRMY